MFKNHFNQMFGSANGFREEFAEVGKRHIEECNKYDCWSLSDCLIVMIGPAGLLLS
jgi:hypothetical protein